MKKIIAIIIIALTLFVVNLNDQVVCPFCDTTQCWFTGNTRIISGKFFTEYRCAFGHVFLVRDR